MTGVVQGVRRALTDAARDGRNLRGAAWAGGEAVWLATPVIRGIAAAHYRAVRHLTKDEIFDCCEALLEAGDHPARTVAFDWAFRCRKRYEAADFARFERWLRQYVDGWGSGDDLCTHALGVLVYEFPTLIPGTMAWAASDNRWLRRAAAVVLICAVRRGAHMDAAFRVADALLADPDDMVQKGYGWLLKEVSNRAPERVFAYVMAHRAEMPRLALRYAIEKLEPSLRQQAMAR